MEATCHASHPPFQGDYSHWKCPSCQGRLVTDTFAADADPGCERLHSDDILVCTNAKCLFSGYGNVVAKFVATRGTHTLCPSCHGRHGAAHCERCSGRGYLPKTTSMLAKAKSA